MGKCFYRAFCEKIALGGWERYVIKEVKSLKANLRSERNELYKKTTI